MANELLSCQLTLRTYGRQASDNEAMVRVFLQDLADYEFGEVVDAIRRWRGKFRDFPTPCDIKRLINGEPTFSADYYRTLKLRAAKGEVLEFGDQVYMEHFDTKLKRGEI